METQLSLFEIQKRKVSGNPYRDTRGRYCDKRQFEDAQKETEMRKLKDKNAYLEQKVEMYERMALALSKRLTNKK